MRCGDFRDFVVRQLSRGKWRRISREAPVSQWHRSTERRPQNRNMPLISQLAQLRPRVVQLRTACALVWNCILSVEARGSRQTRANHAKKILGFPGDLRVPLFTFGHLFEPLRIGVPPRTRVSGCYELLRAAHTSHIHRTRTLIASYPPPFLNTSSLPAPVIKCAGGLLIPSPSALALCGTFALSPPHRCRLRVAKNTWYGRKTGTCYGYLSSKVE